jgi:23S rRNA (cytidine1920-2'-O)/16S rRNA (cytidine1409-2'-O)-methyltransferase
LFSTSKGQSPKKQRLDLLLLDRGLADTRERAQALIMAGRVLVGGQKATRAGLSLPADVILTVTEKPPFVSRGGEKLSHALNAFQVNPNNLVALDVGASTGGFTDCLLQRGSEKIYALDVGYGQLDLRLRDNPLVVVMERVNAHHPFTLPERVALATIDVSFISLTKVIPNVVEHMAQPGLILALVKPQFEAHRSEVGKGGIIKDPVVHARVLGRVAVWAVTFGLRIRGLTPSPLLGTKGNREFFLMLEYQGPVHKA